MTPVLVSVDKAGDLKIGRKKCRLYKKDEVVKVAKKYGINTEKKTIGELCGAIKARAKNSPNNVPLVKMYPEAVKKMIAARKRAEKKALNKKVATNFLKTMTTRIMTPVRVPSKKAMPLTQDEAKKRIKVMKGLTANNKFLLVNKMRLGKHSPRRVVRLAREMARLK